MKQTLAIIKPDAVERGLYGRVIDSYIGAPGLSVDAMEMLRLSETTAMTLYEEHRGRSYFDRLITFTVSGPLIVLALSSDADAGLDVVRYWRYQVAAIRRRWCPPDHPGPDNLVHGSDSALSALRELRIFWPGRSPKPDIDPCSPRLL